MYFVNVLVASAYDFMHLKPCEITASHGKQLGHYK